MVHHTNRHLTSRLTRTVYRHLQTAFLDLMNARLTLSLLSLRLARPQPRSQVMSPDRLEQCTSSRMNSGAREPTDKPQLTRA